MSNDPSKIPLSKLEAFFRDLGLDPLDLSTLRSVHFDPGVVTVVRWRVNEHGQKYVVGEPPELASETVTLEVWNDRRGGVE